MLVHCLICQIEDNISLLAFKLLDALFYINNTNYFIYIWIHIFSKKCLTTDEETVLLLLQMLYRFCQYTIGSSGIILRRLQQLFNISTGAFFY